MNLSGEIIQIEENNTLSFGDFNSDVKKKVNDFEVQGDLYNVRAYSQATRLEKNGSLLLETVPGAFVKGLDVNEKSTTFSVTGRGNTQVTLELEPGKNYKIYVDGIDIGHTHSNLSGKINFSMELGLEPQKVKIEHR